MSVRRSLLSKDLALEPLDAPLQRAQLFAQLRVVGEQGVGLLGGQGKCWEGGVREWHDRIIY